ADDERAAQQPLARQADAGVGQAGVVGRRVVAQGVVQRREIGLRRGAQYTPEGGLDARQLGPRGIEQVVGYGVDAGRQLAWRAIAVADIPADGRIAHDQVESVVPAAALVHRGGVVGGRSLAAQIVFDQRAAR